MPDNFSITKKIYYHDTDAGGIVYYANYLKFLEEARTEFCFHHGIDKTVLGRQDIFFVVAHIDVAYKAPARYLETIRVVTSLEKIGRVSVHFLQQVTRGDTLLVEAKVTWVCVNKELRPRPVPEEMKKLL
ncbi:MAG: YbgC/FadM family acyl-CoA thioesterase [Candidatus Omnitrophica bacterium]|nr:YbgC/FadM family acyl-CoA thioesterase [Candidatus Omnitrophota bacterium]